MNRWKYLPVETNNPLEQYNYRIKENLTKKFKFNAN